MHYPSVGEWRLGNAGLKMADLFKVCCHIGDVIQLLELFFIVVLGGRRGGGVQQEREQICHKMR